MQLSLFLFFFTKHPHCGGMAIPLGLIAILPREWKCKRKARHSLLIPWNGWSMVGKRMKGLGKIIGKAFKEENYWFELDGWVKTQQNNNELGENVGLMQGREKTLMSSEITFCTVESQRDLIKAGDLSHPCLRKAILAETQERAGRWWS